MSVPASPTTPSPTSPTVPGVLSSIPVELLQAIFGYVAAWPTTPWTEGSPTLGDTDLRHVPFCLASVCTQWRTTVLQTPELWSTIYLTDHTLHDSVAYLDVCLDRSAQWPLDIVVDFSHAGPLSNGEAMLIWNRISSHGERWRRCHFAFTITPEISWDKWPESSMCLEELVVVARILESHEIPSKEDDEQRDRRLPVAPRIRRLSLNNIISPSNSFHSLEYLSICLRGNKCGILWDILSQAPLLRKVRIFWPWEQSRLEGPPGQTITLPNLQYLEIYGHTARDFDAYAEKLNFPALHTMTVSTYNCYKLGALFHRVAPQVHTLILRYEGSSYLSPDDARAICKLQCLENFTIRGTRMDDSRPGEDMAFGTSTLGGFYGFFDVLHAAPEMRQLCTLRIVNCSSPREGVNSSFEVDFLDTGKGWTDPRMAPFMNTASPE